MAFLVSPPEFSTKIFFNPNPHSTSQKSLSVLSNHEKLGSRARVRVSGISEVGRNVRLYGQFSAPVKPSKEEEEKHNYYVNMGYAIRTLREEFPALFYRELSFDIYRFYFVSFISDGHEQILFCFNFNDSAVAICFSVYLFWMYSGIINECL